MRIQYGRKARIDSMWLESIGLFCSQIHSSLFFDSALCNLPWSRGERGNFCGLHFPGYNDHWLLDWFVQKEALVDTGGQESENPGYFSLSSCLSSVSGNSCTFFVVIAVASAVVAASSG